MRRPIQGAAALALLVSALAGAAGAQPRAETRPGMRALGDLEGLRRFLIALSAARPSRSQVDEFIRAQSITLASPTRGGSLSIWVQQHCQYRVPLSEPPVDTQMPCIFACEYPPGADDTGDAIGCSFKIPGQSP